MTTRSVRTPATKAASRVTERGRSLTGESSLSRLLFDLEDRLVVPPARSGAAQELECLAAALYVQLLQHGPDVASNGDIRDQELRRDLTGRKPSAHAIEHLPFPARQIDIAPIWNSQMPFRAACTQSIHQHGHQRAGDRGLAEKHGAYDRREALGRDALGQVPDRAHRHRLEKVLLVESGGEHDDRDARPPSTHLGSRYEPATRNVDVDEAHVRLEAADRVDELCSAGDSTTDDDAFLLEGHPDSVERRRIVTRHENARSRARVDGLFFTRRTLADEIGTRRSHAAARLGNSRRLETLGERRCRNIK